MSATDSAADEKLGTAAERDTEATRSAMTRLPLAMVLSDPNLDDNPIVFVNKAFEKLTLYTADAAIGRNCRFLQGEGTDPSETAKIRKAIEAGEDVSVDIVNYKSDGTPFRNRLLVAPIRNDQDKLVGFLGVQRELPPDGEGEIEAPDQDTMLFEVQHRVKNHLAMIVSMIRMQAEKKVTKASFEALSHRIESIALLYDELSGVGNAGADEMAAGAYLSRVASAMAVIQGSAAVRINIECQEITLPVELTARLGLLLTEFLTNALEHAFIGREKGLVTVRFQQLTGGAIRLTVEDDGVGFPEESGWPWASASVEDQKARIEETEGEIDTRGHGGKSGLGGTIVTALAKTIGAELSVNSSSCGTIVTLQFGNAKG